MAGPLNPELVRVARSAREEIAATVRQEEGAGAVLAGAKRAMRMASEAARQSPFASQYECKSGCAFCCVVPVSVNAPEALRIGTRLLATQSPEEIAELRTHLEARQALLDGKEWDYQSNHVIPCAFLTGESRCGIYEERPIACRSWCSMSAAACEKSMRHRSELNVPADNLLVVTGVVVRVALQLELRARGHEAGPLMELQGAVLRVLQTPKAAEAWATGVDVFAGCRLDSSLPAGEAEQFVASLDNATRQ